MCPGVSSNTSFWNFWKILRNVGGVLFFMTESQRKKIPNVFGDSSITKYGRNMVLLKIGRKHPTDHYDTSYVVISAKMKKLCMHIKKKVKILTESGCQNTKIQKKLFSKVSHHSDKPPPPIIFRTTRYYNSRNIIFRGYNNLRNFSFQPIFALFREFCRF